MPDDVAHDLRILLGILRHHRDKLSQEAVDTVNRAFTNLLNDEDLPIDRSEIPTAAGGVLAVTGTMMLITALLRKGGKPTTPLDPTLGGGGGEPTPGPTATTDDDIIDAVVRYDDEGDPEKFEEGLRRRSTDEKL